MNHPAKKMDLSMVVQTTDGIIHLIFHVDSFFFLFQQEKNNNTKSIVDVFAKKLFAKTLCPSALQYLSIHYDLHNLYGYLQAKKTNE